jgi:NADH-quinone oxidoreductase subunit L
MNVPAQLALILIPLFPLAGFLANGLLGRRMGRNTGGKIACLMPLLSFICSVGVIVDLCDHWPHVSAHLFQWMSVGGFTINFGLEADSLTAVMLLVVTGVGTLIHIYSLGYMAKDEGWHRYFAYLNLFMFMMLILVTADSLPLMFVGWEGVGLCSYLLIGFWYTDLAKSAAGMKAFIVNRIGDLGFILGIFTIWSLTAAVGSQRGISGGSMSFGGLWRSLIGLGYGYGYGHPVVPSGVFAGWEEGSVITLACLLLFAGAIGKSAQIPLYIWLPDAMAGPTPVSALIHAATMVTAGVYMVARLHWLFAISEVAMTVIAIVGAATALWAALQAMTQTDIKKVLAYSTVSQLGYMFLALGAGAVSAAMFHLTTHAFFKALLFLGAGSVITACHHEQDLRRLGGLRRRMPITYLTMVIGALALAGLPLMSGMISKDEILWRTLFKGLDKPSSLFFVLWICAQATAVLTAFYAFRLIALTFHGKTRMESGAYEHVHESPRVMTVPLMVLAFLAAAGGLLNWPAAFGGSHRPLFSRIIGDGLSESIADRYHSPEMVALWLSMGLAVVTIFVTSRYASRKPLLLQRPGNFLGRMFFDIPAAVDSVTESAARLTVGGARLCWHLGDRLMINGFIGSLTEGVKGWAEALRRLHAGLVNVYALAVALGAAILLWWLIF